MGEVPRESRKCELKHRGNLSSTCTYLERDHKSVIYVCNPWYEGALDWAAGYLQLSFH